MADTILSGDITVNYSDDNRRKSLNWSGGASTTYTMNQVYSALQDLFDETGQMDDGTVMSAETPTEYTIGIIDSGDSDPWYITYDLMEHIAGDTTLGQRAGALRTASWTRVQDSNTGIVVVAVTTNNIVTGDIGQDVTHGDGDSGTLLDVIEAGATDYLVIRPDSYAAANNWDSTSGTITEQGSSKTATQAAAAVTGEQIWANFYTIGTIENDTHIYFYQGATSDASRARISAIADSTQDWWSDGHVDICIFTRDYTQASNPLIDSGYVKAYARKGSTYYDSFEASSSTTSGGSNPVPINTSADLDNATGYKSITTTAVATDDFTVGNEINGGTSGARAVITSISGTSPTYTFHYYLLDDPQTDFQTAAETITNADATGSATKDGNAPSDQGPALTTWFTDAGGSAAPTISFTHTTYDVDDNGTDENYGITIDCNSNTLSYVYEWLKYITRDGETSTTYTDGIEGEQYVGAEAYLAWTGSVTGTIAEGANVTQETSGATGTIISYYDSGGSGGYVLLRDVRGTFATHATTATLTDNDNSGTVEIDSVATNFAPNKQAPFGSFPGGGTFFGARGVLLSDWDTTDENNFSLIPVNGGTKLRPQAYSITVTNLVGTSEATTTDDRVTVFRLTGSGGNIDKTEFTAYGGEAVAAGTLDTTAACGVDVPGKTSGGVLRIIDDSHANKLGYRIRYSSWANDGGAGSSGSFTLAKVSPSNLAAGTNTTTIVSSTDELDNLKRGDLVLNEDQSNAVSYVTSVNSGTNTVTISPAITSQTSTDTIHFNALPIAPEASTDSIYVPLIDTYATASTASVSIIYDTTIYYRARVRNVAATSPDGPIKPFEVDSSLSGANSSVQTVRTIDTIYT